MPVSRYLNKSKNLVSAGTFAIEDRLKRAVHVQVALNISKAASGVATHREGRV